MGDFNIGDEVIRHVVGLDGKPFGDKPCVVVKVDLEKPFLM